MKSYIDPKEMAEALQYARKIRSDALYSMIKSAKDALTELFTSYNPQIIFRR